MHSQRSRDQEKEEKEPATSRIVFQGVVCCIVTRFDCGSGTHFSLNRIQRQKTSASAGTETIKKEKDRQGKSVRTAELHNKWKQHGSYQRGAPGLLQVTNDALLTLSLSLSLSHTHTPTLCSKWLTHSHQCAQKMPLPCIHCLTVKNTT